MNNNIAAFLIATCSLINTSCTDSSKAEANSYEFKKLPQSSFAGIPFPGTKEQAKLAGFTNCTSSGENTYKCALNKNLTFKGFEFEKVYVTLDTNNNLADFGSTLDENAIDTRAYKTSNNVSKYTYRSIKLTSKQELDSNCAEAYIKTRREKSASQNQYLDMFKGNPHCSQGSIFLKQLEATGWIRHCESGQLNCAYYSQNNTFRIVTSKDPSKPDYINHDGLFMDTLILTIEPLSPSEHGEYFTKAILEELEEESRKFDSEKKSLKAERFIQSMAN